MTEATNLGANWRKQIIPALENFGIVVFDPLNKTIPIGDESPAARAQLQQYRKNGDLEAIRDFIKPVRRVDLRSVDLSSFIIVMLDGTPTVGTYEEIDKATFQQKPILFWLKPPITKLTINPWLLAQVPINYFFESLDELLHYLHTINVSSEHPDDKRWMLFDFAKMYRKVL
jgi:hypothetical protein